MAKILFSICDARIIQRGMCATVWAHVAPDEIQSQTLLASEQRVILMISINMKPNLRIDWLHVL